MAPSGNHTKKSSNLRVPCIFDFWRHCTFAQIGVNLPLTCHLKTLRYRSSVYWAAGCKPRRSEKRPDATDRDSFFVTRIDSARILLGVVWIMSETRAKGWSTLVDWLAAWFDRCLTRFVAWLSDLPARMLAGLLAGLAAWLNGWLADSLVRWLTA